MGLVGSSLNMYLLSISHVLAEWRSGNLLLFAALGAGVLLLVSLEGVVPAFGAGFKEDSVFDIEDVQTATQPESNQLRFPH